jgi:hypothetical protein
LTANFSEQTFVAFETVLEKDASAERF